MMLPVLVIDFGLSDDLYILLDRIVQQTRTFPTAPAGSEPHDTLVVYHNVGGKSVHAERPLDPSIAIPILRPNHFVLGRKLAPRFLFAIGTDPIQDE